MHIRVYPYIYCYYSFGGGISSMNKYEVFIYNHNGYNLPSRSSRVKASMVLTRADHLFIHNYITSHLNTILRPILMVRIILLVSLMP